jgi:hypothetical protein
MAAFPHAGHFFITKVGIEVFSCGERGKIKPGSASRGMCAE